jgi:predicted dehydrogenase
MTDKIRVGVIGAGKWCGTAHLPGFCASPLCELVMICDTDQELAESRAAQFGIPEVTHDYEELLARKDIDVVDIVTNGDSHEPLTFAALEAGKHVLVEKPVCHNYQDVLRADELAKSKGLLTKVGLTFRYAPAVQYMFDLVREGYIGDPYVFNGYEQNCQWIDPNTPMDKRNHKVKPEGPSPYANAIGREGIHVGSLEGYGAPTIDIGLELVQSNLKQVVGILQNMIPYRRRTQVDTEWERINIDDADIFIGECENGALYSLQTSYVTVGNYPGIEAHIYGSKGALKVRLVDEFGVIQTLHGAKPDAVEFVPMDIPARYFPPAYHAGQSWGSVFYSCLIQNFMEEIRAGGKVNQGNFRQSARVQEVINAATLSHREHRWVDLPLNR